MPLNWERLNLDPEVVSVGTSRVLRVRRIGTTYFAENMQERRTLRDDGSEALEEDWKVVAVAKPDIASPGRTPRAEIHEWLARANVEVCRQIAVIHRERTGNLKKDAER